MSKRKLLTIAGALIMAAAIMLVNSSYISAKNMPAKKQVETVKSADVLSSIDKYQEQYFKIVKRNDVFLQFEDREALKKDRKELKKLFAEVKKQIKDKDDLKKYKEIEKRYAECEEITTTGMNEFAENNYKEVDALLNEVYKKVQAKIPPEDFKKLTLSEKKWLKEVQDYKKIFDAQGFGSIGTVIYYDYEISMRQFRTLLLMLYL